MARMVVRLVAHTPWLSVIVPITVDYGSHKGKIEQWAHKPELHCPHCGEKSVWVDLGAGDYYQGPQHLCLGCEWEFSLDMGPISRHGPKGYEDDGSAELQRIREIRLACQ